MKPMTTEKPTKTREKSVSVSPDTDTRERLLLTAARLFNHLGYAATTLREIAKEANIKAGSIYYHFDSKEQILDEVLDKGIQVVFDVVKSRIDALPPGATVRERLVTAIEGHLRAVLQHGDFTSANIRIYEQIPTAAKNRHRRVRRAYGEYWDRLLEDALKEGELRTDGSTTVIRLFVIGALNSTVEWYNPNRGSFENFAKQITSLIFDGPLRRE